MKDDELKDIKEQFEGYIEITDEPQTHQAYPVKLNEVQADLVMSAFNDVMTNVDQLISDRIVGELEELQKVFGKDDIAAINTWNFLEELINAYKAKKEEQR